ncbi:hypothetical protein AOLI_G00007120 [Acnodon oligacanthus]
MDTATPNLLTPVHWNRGPWRWDRGGSAGNPQIITSVRLQLALIAALQRRKTRLSANKARPDPHDLLHSEETTQISLSTSRHAHQCTKRLPSRGFLSLPWKNLSSCSIWKWQVDGKTQIRHDRVYQLVLISSPFVIGPFVAISKLFLVTAIAVHLQLGEVAEQPRIIHRAADAATLSPPYFFPTRFLTRPRPLRCDWRTGRTQKQSANPGAGGGNGQPIPEQEKARRRTDDEFELLAYPSVVLGQSSQS